MVTETGDVDDEIEEKWIEDMTRIDGRKSLWIIVSALSSILICGFWCVEILHYWTFLTSFINAMSRLVTLYKSLFFQ